MILRVAVKISLWILPLHPIPSPCLLRFHHWKLSKFEFEIIKIGSTSANMKNSTSNQHEAGIVKSRQTIWQLSYCYRDSLRCNTLLRSVGYGRLGPRSMLIEVKTSIQNQDISGHQRKQLKRIYLSLFISKAYGERKI